MISIIVAATVAAVFLAIIIFNIFIPVKYITAYLTPGAKRERGVMTVSYLDIGYGDCILVELPDGKTMLIDGGDGSYPHTLAIMDYLHGRGADKIDYLVCTSVKGEHCGGLAELVRYNEVGVVYLPYVKNTYITDAYHSFAEEVNRKKCNTKIACFGEGCAEQDPDYFFTFISPSHYTNDEGEYAQLNKTASTDNIHNASAVLWLQYAGTAFVFASDAGQETLKKITEEYRNNVLLGQPFCPTDGYSVSLPDCTIVTVAGHGYEDCTFAEWYDCLNADVAVLSTGKNYSGCPSAQALADVMNRSDVVRTDKQGTITVTVTAGGYSL